MIELEDTDLDEFQQLLLLEWEHKSPASQEFEDRILSLRNMGLFG